MIIIITKTTNAIPTKETESSSMLFGFLGKQSRKSEVIVTMTKVISRERMIAERTPRVKVMMNILRRN